MPKQRNKDKDLPPPPVKETQIFRLLPETVRRLKIAANRRGWSKTTYVEAAIQEKLKKDGIK
jgi:predicted DNA-binding protein